MTLATTITKVSYTGNGATTEFAISFPFVKDADMHALILENGVETTLEQGTRYTLSGAGESTGGALTMLTAPTSSQTLVIWRKPDIVQETDYVENSAFPAETHEAALDLLTMICQALQEQIDRSVKVDISSTAAPDALLTQLETNAAAAASAAAEAQTAQTSAATSAASAAASAENAAASVTAAQASVGAVRASPTDATAGVLSAKLLAGDGVGLALRNPGANESLVASVESAILTAARILNHSLNGGF